MLSTGAKGELVHSLPSELLKLQWPGEKKKKSGFNLTLKESDHGPQRKDS